VDAMSRVSGHRLTSSPAEPFLAAGAFRRTPAALAQPGWVFRRTLALMSSRPQWIPCACPTTREPHRSLHLAEPQLTLRIPFG
jgi:hypothetical protein